MSDAPMFGVPGAGGIMAVRASSPTPIQIYPMLHGPFAQAFVTQPASWPALIFSERVRLSEFFDLEDRDAYWWRTLRPAVISLERVSRGVWAGRMKERGFLVAAGSDPSIVPEGHVFRMLLPRHGQTLRDRDGPQVSVPENEIMSSHATRTVEASFRTLGSHSVWLRIFKDGGEREAHVAALQRELEVIRAVAKREPTLVPEVLHDGKLETLFYSGRYAALEKHVGLSWSEAHKAAGHTPFSKTHLVIRDIFGDVARIVAAAHAEGFCIGPLSPGLIRVRLAFSMPSIGGSATVISMPGAGPRKGAIPPSVMELFPEGQADALVRQFDKPYRRSFKMDLVGLGELLDWLLADAASNNDHLRRLSLSLKDGDINNADVITERLREVI